ncbi:MAG: substrate-binding domain-containing protein, partial [Planctomycetota bacterium]|nr:substrate-binding domain-containing protein [Planctomycetota bacterium]
SNLRVSYFVDIAHGIQNELLAVDCLPILLDLVQDDERKGIRRLIEHRVDGMILSIVDESIHMAEIREILQVDLPLVLVDREVMACTCDFVGVDDVAGGRLAGEHLAALGHKIFGFCYYGEGSSTCDARLEGFRQGLAQSGLVLRNENIVRLPAREPDRETHFYNDLLALLRRPDRPTAIFAPTDLLARRVYCAAREVGLSIPSDLSVIGYADLEFAAYLEPPLTTIRQDGKEVGRQAARLMLQRLEQEMRPPQRILLPVTLVPRRSTAPPPGTV